MRRQVWSMFTSLTTSRDLDLKVENKVKPVYTEFKYGGPLGRRPERVA